VKPAFWLRPLFWKLGDVGTDRPLRPQRRRLGGRRAASLAKKLQSGYLYSYALVMLLGLVAAVTWVMVRASMSGFPILSLMLLVPLAGAWPACSSRRTAGAWIALARRWSTFRARHVLWPITTSAARSGSSPSGRPVRRLLSGRWASTASR
jgi:hypothetical protein